MCPIVRFNISVTSCPDILLFASSTALSMVLDKVCCAWPTLLMLTESLGSSFVPALSDFRCLFMLFSSLPSSFCVDPAAAPSLPADTELVIIAS